MPKQLLQINFEFAFSSTEYERKTEEAATYFAAVPGLIWKTWLLSREKKEAGGIYLFESEQALENYLGSDLFKSIGTTRGFSNVTVKRFDLLAKPGQLTHAPVHTTIENELDYSEDLSC